MDALGSSLQQTQILLDLFASVLDDPTALQSSPQDGAPVAADVHRLVLFLFVQYYTREAARSDTADVWPADHPSATQLEPSSPMRLAARSWMSSKEPKEQQAHHRAYLPATRQKIQEHLFYEDALVNGFGAFLAKHAVEILELVATGGLAAASSSGRAPSFGAEDDIFDASASEVEDQYQGGGAYLSVAEVDRLGFLISVADGAVGYGGQEEMPFERAPREFALKPEDFQQERQEEEEEGMEAMMDDAPPMRTSIDGGGGGGGNDAEMEFCGPSSQFQQQQQHQRLSLSLPPYLWTSSPPPSSSFTAHDPATANANTTSSVSTASMATWLRESLAPETTTTGALPQPYHITTASDGGGGGGDVSMLGMSPPRISMFDQLAPPSLSLLTPTDVHGLHRATALRGQSDMARQSGIRILDCHDAIVYCLAPLQYTTISCCTDCIIVLGAVGSAVRLERCERVQVVVAAQRVVINTCHDCILYLAVNRPPLLLGDNRFVQLAPHNAGYDSLKDHVVRAGVVVDSTAWCNAVPLLPDPGHHVAAIKHQNALLAGGGSYGSSPPSNHNNSQFLNSSSKQISASSPMTLSSGGGGGIGDSTMVLSPSTAAVAATAVSTPFILPSDTTTLPITTTTTTSGSGDALQEQPATTISPVVTVSLSPLKMPASLHSPSLGGGGGSSSSGGSGMSSPAAAAAAGVGVGGGASPHHPPPAMLLPPDKLVPFLVPFTGGEGPMCGGPTAGSSSSSSSAAAASGYHHHHHHHEDDLLGGMLGGVGAEAFGRSPFPLPPEFATAWEERMTGMAAVRSSYRQARLDDAHKREFIAAIQSHFKEWLQAGSGMRMREVYDLARFESDKNKQ